MHSPGLAWCDISSIRPLIVGRRGDVHTAAVLDGLARRGIEASVFDASALETGEAHFSGGGPEVSGWVRRLAPPGWGNGGLNASHDGARASAWSALTAGMILAAECHWLTTLPALLAAENKLFQLATAGRLGIRVPMTVVPRDLAELARAGLSTAVVKPLGRGHYTDGAGEERFVPAQLIDTTDLTDAELVAAPFLFQEPIHAVSHLRVVTVAGRVFVAELDAGDVPLDWRLHEPAHDSFVPALGAYQDVERQALALAVATSTGYTSQDWIIDQHGDQVFLDLNPAGQWLFLPEEIAQEVTLCHVKFLTRPNP